MYIYIIKSLEFGTGSIHSTKYIDATIKYYNNQRPTMKITHVYELSDQDTDLCYKLNASITHLYDEIKTHYIITSTWPNINSNLIVYDNQIVECFLTMFKYNYSIKPTINVDIDVDVCDEKSYDTMMNELEKAVVYFEFPENRYLSDFYKYLTFYKMMGFIYNKLKLV